jgi:FSR family fosmidomycin resistance protein-like MFS transporter
MGLLNDAVFSSIAFSHFTVDLLNGQRSVLLTFVAVQVGMNNTALGLATTIYILTAALIQPFAGAVADRYGARWVAAGGVLWMAVFFSLGLLASGQASIILLVIASLGSGAFHPAGAMQATLVGRTHFSGRETTAAASFFAFGQMGYFVGPMLAGPLLDHFGPPGLLVMSLLAFPIGFYAAGHLKDALYVPKMTGDALPLTAADPQPAMGETHNSHPVIWLVILAYIPLAVFQSWASQNMTTFIPKYLSDMGQSASVYGFIAALFMGGTTLGNLAGGTLADRYGARRVSFITLSLAAVPLFLIPSVGFSWSLFLLVPLAGFLVGATNSIIIVQGQSMIPGGMAMVSGLVLGLSFAAGALGTFLTGRLADLWGFSPVFRLSGLLVLVCGLLALAITWKKNGVTADAPA